MTESGHVIAVTWVANTKPTAVRRISSGSSPSCDLRTLAPVTVRYFSAIPLVLVQCAQGVGGEDAIDNGRDHRHPKAPGAFHDP